MDRFGPTGKVSKKRVHLLRWTTGAIHSTKISGNFGPKLNGSVRSNRKSFEKTGPPFEVVLFSRSDRSEFWLNGSRPYSPVILWKKIGQPATNCNRRFFNGFRLCNVSLLTYQKSQKNPITGSYQKTGFIMKF